MLPTMLVESSDTLDRSRIPFVKTACCGRYRGRLMRLISLLTIGLFIQSVKPNRQDRPLKCVTAATAIGVLPIMSATTRAGCQQRLGGDLPVRYTVAAVGRHQV